jgi:hypothetical protein
LILNENNYNPTLIFSAFRAARMTYLDWEFNLPRRTSMSKLEIQVSICTSLTENSSQENIDGSQFVKQNITIMFLEHVCSE